MHTSPQFLAGFFVSATHLSQARHLAAITLSANASETTAPEVARKPLKGSYTIYSGELGEKSPPTRQDRKLAIEITGPATRDVFHSLYPDAKVSCSGAKGERLRSKGEVWCIHQPPNLYRCFLGFNLRTGASY